MPPPSRNRYVSPTRPKGPGMWRSRSLQFPQIGRRAEWEHSHDGGATNYIIGCLLARLATANSTHMPEKTNIEWTIPGLKYVLTDHGCNRTAQQCDSKMPIGYRMHK